MGAWAAGGPIPSLLFGDDDEHCARRHVPDYGEGVTEEDVEAVRAMLCGGSAWWPHEALKIVDKKEKENG
jgi:hypothetical protein